MTTTAIETVPRGGEWLLEAAPADTVFTPERMTEEHRLIQQTAQEFTNEVAGHTEQLETKDWDLTRELLRRAGELGLLATDVPEAYGGLALDKASAAIIAGCLGQCGSFSATYGAHANLAILPIRMFGTDEQKQRYLPDLVTGETVGAYCLSEAGSGSDALGAKARASRQADGSFVLNGEKMWITNGGFADLYIVFAKVDGEHFTAFIVERGFEGVSTGKEEHKMGLHGSSTTPVILQDVRVPADNLLGAVGKGHKVAFNVLNYGRFKLGASTVGGARGAIGEAARYAASRRQFGQPIASFGAVKHKIGGMVARTYALESMVFRTVGLIDGTLEGVDPGDGGAILRALEEYAVESSILKVAGSETLHDVLDENVQIHGGNGFVRDYPAERHYRDSRVNRIFEGTNEINRLLIPGMLVKRAVKGDLPLIPAAKKLQDEILAPSGAAAAPEGPLDAAAAAVGMFRKVGLAVIGLAMQTYGQKLGEQQEVLSFAADVVIDTYAADSAVARARAAAAAGATGADLQADAAASYVDGAAMRIETTARSAFAAMAEGDELRTRLAGLRRLLKVTPANDVRLRRRLSDAAVERGAYPL